MGLQRHQWPSVWRANTGKIRKRGVALKSLQFGWADAIAGGEWEQYTSAIQALRRQKVEFLVGGGFARAAFTGYWRDTKDIDFYVRPEDRERAAQALEGQNFADYYEKVPYDRNWIHRSYKKDVIVDVIWAMANQRAQVDDVWFEHAPSITIRRERLLLIPPEELLWCKLYIIQRDRCDWTDIFNLVHEHGPRMDWAHLIGRLEDDVPLLRAMLEVYRWLCPEDINRLPSSLWPQLAAAEKATRSQRPAHDRVRLLDSRIWFGARINRNQKLEV